MESLNVKVMLDSAWSVVFKVSLNTTPLNS